MDTVQLKKLRKEFDIENLHLLSKEELIDKVKILHSHNVQLKNIIDKSSHPKVQKRRKTQKPFDFTTCNKRHILLKFLYLGWDYQGYAVQEDTFKTIEHELFHALIKTCLIKDRASSNYHRCGRTDKGVSSFGQVISIDVRSRISQSESNLENEINYCGILNKVLPPTIQCVGWCPVDDNFSARFDCKGRTYKYFFPKANLNIERMEEAAQFLVGSHDFRNFCKMDVGNGVIKFIRSISSIEIEPCSPETDEQSMYVITIRGQAFLWHQIRCIMGVLILIGQNQEEPAIVKSLLDVDENPRKPDYNLASEVPLNLYYCDYEVPEKDWQYDCTSLNLVILKLNAIWTLSSVKSTMLNHILGDLQKIVRDKAGESEVLTNNCLLNGVKAKNYIPLMQRQKCDSLEDRIQHFVKRQRLEILRSNKEVIST